MMRVDRTDDIAAFCDGVGMSAVQARTTIRRLASHVGYRPEALVEWCSADAPGTPSDLPPLYYAALLSDDPAADMPLGLGETPTTALTDLLWSLGGATLLAELREPEREPAPDDEAPATLAGGEVLSPAR